MSELNPQQKGCLGCLSVIAILCAAILIPAAISDSRRAARIDRAMDGRPDATITAGQLLADRQGTSYNDRVVLVRGFVQATSVDALSVVAYIGETKTGDAISCYFDQASGPMVGALTPGTIVAIRGVASTGIIPLMNRCQLEAN